MIHGENLILALSGTPLAASKSCSLSKSSSFIEVAPPTAGDWEEYVPSKKGWKMSSDCLLGTMEAYKTLDAAWKNGTALTMRFYNTEFNENETGTVYIENLDLTASTGNLAKMSVSLKGSGALSEYAGTSLTVTRTLQQTGKYYKPSTSGSYSVITGGDDRAKIYSGTFSLSSRSLVNVISSERTYNYIFLSQSTNIVYEAQNEITIPPSDYVAVLRNGGSVWLDAGTWYVVESNEDYYTPTYKKMSI